MKACNSPRVRVLPSTRLPPNHHSRIEPVEVMKVIAGMKLAMQAAGASRGVIAIKKKG